MFQLRRARRSALAGVVLVAVAGSATALFSGGGTALAEPTPTPLKPRAEHIPPAYDSGKVVKDSYIVGFKNGKVKATDVTSRSKALTQTYGGSVRRTFSKSIRGYSATMSAAQAKKLAKDPNVAFVEQNRVLTKSDFGDTAWGLDRVDQRFLPRDQAAYTPPHSASNVRVYVLDTGIRTTHPQFGPRAVYGIDTVDEFEAVSRTWPSGHAEDDVATDCEGHGTHVAGTIGSRDYGIAPDVGLVAVQVLDCDGEGTSDEIVAGIEWVTRDAAAHPDNPAVANMSLGGGASTAIDNAVRASIAAGVTYTLAAGNGHFNAVTKVYEPDDACTRSPARVTEAITVSATDEADFRVSWAGFGTCVDIFAPGNDLLSTYYDRTAPPGEEEGTAYLSGTSMASPHAAGAAALLLANDPSLTPERVRNSLVGNASRGAVKNIRAGSPDRLLRIGSGLPSTTALRAKANGKLVTTPGAGASALIASAAHALSSEQYGLIQNGDGTVSFRAKSNGKFVSAESGGAKPLIANRTAIGLWEKFDLSDNGDGTVSLKARANGKFVSADSAGAKPLIANRTAIGDWEKLTLTNPVPAVVLLAAANGYVVTAESGGAKPLIANRGAYGRWETFDMIDLGNGNIALRAHANGRYVTAESAGAKPLIANRTSVGAWEAFELVHLGGPHAYKANANKKWVCAESEGAKPLIANRAAPGPWEAFWFVY